MLTMSASVALTTILQATEYDGGGGGGIAGVFAMLISLALAVLFIAAGWKIYTKAGEPGWACIVPIYNIVVMLKIVKRPLWWIILLFIPLANVIVGIILAVDLAKAFGKGVGFAIGLILLPFIFYLVLGFGDAQYQG